VFTIVHIADKEPPNINEIAKFKTIAPIVAIIDVPAAEPN
jgi:hypothetical protein